MSFAQRAMIVSPITRFLVGLVFIYSGYIKIVEPAEVFYNSIMSYKVFGHGISYIASLTFPWFELYLGVFLVFGLFERYVIRIGMVVLVFFEILLLQAMVRKLEVVSCGCFGSKHSNPIWLEFLLNLIWLFFLYISDRFRGILSLDYLIERRFGR